MENSEYRIKESFKISDLMEILLLEEFNFKNYSELYEIVWYILESSNFIDNNYLHYLDFDVEVDSEGTDIKIIGNNIVTSLWFSNIFPEDPDDCYIKGEYQTKNKKYKYNPIEKSLLIKNLN